MRNVRQILFDFDYTLADSSEGIIASVNHALQTIGESAADPEAIRKTIGHSLEQTFSHFIDASRTDDIQRCKKLFMEFADTGAMVRNTWILDGVRETLESLRSGLLKLGIVSTKRRSTIEETLVSNALDKHFSVVIGYEDVTALKPDPQGLLKAMNVLAGRAEETVYVGDNPIDIRAARSAGLRVIAVASGTTTVDELSSHRPDLVIQKFTELQNLFAA